MGIPSPVRNLARAHGLDLSMGIQSPVRRLARAHGLDLFLGESPACPEKPEKPVVVAPIVDKCCHADSAVWADLKLVVQICEFAGGPPAARHFAAASSTLSKVVTQGWTQLVEGFSHRLYVVGGLDGDYRPVDTVERFDARVGVWETLQPMKAPRAGACTVGAGGRLYVLGGEAHGHPLSDAQRYDPWTEQWEMLPAMNSARIRAAAVGAGNFLFVLGGLDGSRALRSFERYEPKSRKWQELPPMQRARYACSAAAHGRWIFAFGGELAESGALGSIERYDRETGQWELLPPVQAPGCGSATVLSFPARAAFSLGGLGLSGQAQGVAKRLNLETALLGEAPDAKARSEPLRWSCVPPMPTARHQASAAAFCGGTVAVGGKGAKFEPVGDVEFFDAERWAWEVLPPLPNPRLRAAVAGGRF